MSVFQTTQRTRDSLYLYPVLLCRLHRFWGASFGLLQRARNAENLFAYIATMKNAAEWSMRFWDRGFLSVYMYDESIHNMSTEALHILLSLLALVLPLS